MARFEHAWCISGKAFSPCRIFSIPEQKEDEQMKKQANCFYLAAFLIPFLALGMIYACFGIAPFGEKSLLIMDLNAQGVDFFSHVRDMLLSGESPIYSFHKGAGGNMIGLLGFYGGLPLTFLSALFPADKMPEAIFLINCLLVGFCGLTMFFLLQSYQEKPNASALIFSSAYALMSYSIVYAMEFQWIYGAMFLPLIVLGVNKIIDGGKWGVFVASYTALLLCNAYTGYMVTLFSALYFLWRIFSDEKRENTKKKFLTFAVAGIGGFFLSAFWTLPQFATILAGREGQALNSPDRSISFAVQKIWTKFFIGQYDGITNFSDDGGTVSFFCGLFILGFFIYYFVCKRISKREKLCSGTMILIFALSVCFLKLDKVWHLFAYPNWFPYRWAFLISFFMVFLAFRGWSNRPKESDAPVYTFMGLGLALCLIFLFIPDILCDTELAALSLAFVFIYALLLFSKLKQKKALPLMLLAILLTEMISNGVFLMKGLDREFGYRQREDYEITSLVDDMADEIYAYDPSPFYRIEKTDLRTDNDALNAGYPGITHYSSTFDKRFNDLNFSLGLLQEWYACRYLGGTPLVDSIFGIKYLMSRHQPTDSEAYTKIFSMGDYDVYQNENALPLGFMIEGSGETPAYHRNDFLVNQNLFYKAITGEDGFAEISAGTEDNITYRLTITEAKPLYISFPTKIGANLFLFKNGEPVALRNTVETKCKLLGTFGVGDEITVVLPGAMSNVNFAYLEDELLAEKAKEMQKNGLTVTSFQDTRIEGTVNAEKDGMFMTTILYDKGWQVLLDGEKVEPELTMGAFWGFLMPKGEHELSLRYEPTGMRLGIWISCLSLLVLAVLLYKNKKKNPKIHIIH